VGKQGIEKKVSFSTKKKSAYCYNIEKGTGETNYGNLQSLGESGERKGGVFIRGKKKKMTNYTDQRPITIKE